MGLIFAVMPIPKSGRLWICAKGFERIDAHVNSGFGRIEQGASQIHCRAYARAFIGLCTGDYFGDFLNLSLQVIEDLRRTNLAHLLAISVLHMGLLTTVVFGLLRMICVVIPIGHIRWHADQLLRLGRLWRGGLFGIVGQFDCNTTCLCHDCLFLWRCDPVTARLNAATLGACGAYNFGIAARGALFPGISNVLRGDHCIGQCI